MPFSVVADHPDCDPGTWAVVNNADNSVVGCYPTELDAMDAMNALMDAEQNSDDAEGNPRENDEPVAVLAGYEEASRPTLELIRGGGDPRAARAAKVGREERSGTLEVREVTLEGGATGREVFGYASRTGVPYTVTDMFGDYTETIDAGAFERSIREQDVRLYVNHDGMALARSSVNLTLREDQQGLYYSAPVDPSVTFIGDLVKLMDAGIMRESSFAFQPIRQTWNADYTDRHIQEVKLYDVSVVSLPASPTTSAGVRSMLADVIERQEPVELELALRLAMLSPELRVGKVLSAANEKIVRDAVDALSAMLASLEKSSDGGDRDAGSMMIEKALVELARRRR